MTQVGQMLIDEGIELGRKEGLEQGIQAFIQDNREEGVPADRIIEKLKKRFQLSETKARTYLKKFS